MLLGVRYENICLEQFDYVRKWFLHTQGDSRKRLLYKQDDIRKGLSYKQSDIWN